MKLKEIRESRQIRQVDMVDKLRKVEPRVDISTYSRYENGVCLPTPPQLTCIAQALDTSPDKLYAPEEVDFGIHGVRKLKRRRDIYKIQFEIHSEYMSRTRLKTLIKFAGYASQTAWLLSCLRDLQAACKQKEIAREAAASASDQSHNTNMIHEDT